MDTTKATGENWGCNKGQHPLARDQPGWASHPPLLGCSCVLTVPIVKGCYKITARSHILASFSSFLSPPTTTLLHQPDLLVNYIRFKRKTQALSSLQSSRRLQINLKVYTLIPEQNLSQNEVLGHPRPRRRCCGQQQPDRELRHRDRHGRHHLLPRADRDHLRRRHLHRHRGHHPDHHRLQPLHHPQAHHHHRLSHLLLLVHLPCVDIINQRRDN